MSATANSPDTALHVWLRASAVFTLSGAVLFGIPHAGLASMTGLPTEVPVIYRALTVLMMLLFGGAYAWMSAQRVVDRTLVTFGAIAKLAAFMTLTSLCIAAEVTTRTWALVSADLVFACAFFWCLHSARKSALATRSAE